jgi:protein virilizer
MEASPRVGSAGPSIEEETISPEEQLQFEPILSDEEIGDDPSGSCFDDLYFDPTDYEPVINSIDPFTTEWHKFSNEPEDKKISLQFDEIKQLLLVNVNKFTNISISSIQDQRKLDWLNFLEDELLLKLIKFNKNDHQKNSELLKSFLLTEPVVGGFLVESIKIGLNYDQSIIEPRHYNRHIHVGLQLTQNLLCYEFFIEQLIHDSDSTDHPFNIFQQLFIIYSQLWSSKLMILKTIYSVLNTKVAILYFLGENQEIFQENNEDTAWETTKNFNGYKHLLKLIESSNPNKRTMFFLKSLLKKIHLYETLGLVASIVERQYEAIATEKDDQDTSMLEGCLHEIYKACTWNEISYLQLDRFLPVTAIFSIRKESSALEKFRSGLFMHFHINLYLESLLVIITMRDKLSPILIDVVFNCVHALLCTPQGLDYLIKNIDTTNVLMKSLFDFPPVPSINMEEKENKLNVLNDSQSHTLGLEIYYKIQTICYLTSISNCSTSIIDDLHSLFSLTCGPGKIYVVEVLTMDHKIQPLLDLIEKEKKLQCKSPILSYSVDLVDCVVRNSKDIKFLEDYGTVLWGLVKQHDIFEPSSSGKYNNTVLSFRILSYKIIQFTTRLSQKKKIIAAKLFDCFKFSIYTI